jgi:oxygen-dependent protoporphyrinogen oxidase
MMPHVVVVGGGLAGLVVAHALEAEARVTILDASSRPGGKIRTDLVDGCLVESGPDSFLSTKPHALALCDELGMAAELEGTIPRRTRGLIARNGKLHPLPEGLSGLIPARLRPMLSTSLLSPGARARFLAEWFVPPQPAGEDESIASFARRRFGDEAWQWLIEPLLGGIFGGDGERLSLRATFPALVDIERRTGSVLAGLRETKRPRPSHPSPFVAPRGGMQRLTDVLQARFAPGIVVDTRVKSIEQQEPGWVVNASDNRIECEVVVLALPANEAASVVEKTDAELASILAAIEFVSATVVNLAYDADGFGAPLDGYGYLNPRAGGRDVMACTWTSSKFEHRTPPDAILLRCFLRGEQWSDNSLASDADLAEACRTELRDALGVTVEPRWTRAARWPAAMPQYNVGHLERMQSLDGALGRHSGLFLTGNSYRGVGIPDTIAHARFVAKRIRERFGLARSRRFRAEQHRFETGGEEMP